MTKLNFTILILFTSLIVTAKKDNSIISGAHWYDNNLNEVSAHGAGIIKQGNKYYLFGELKNDTSNAFVGFSCYSSKNLTDWIFENIALPTQQSGKLGPQRVGERPKVMRCPKTGEYIMFMHTDNLRYKEPCVGYATCDKIDGEYTFQGALLFEGKPIKKWDIGVFQDTDDKGYLITHSGNLYQLSDDYKSITKQVVKDMTSKCESPVIFKRKGIYFWIGSGLSGWERNDNYYFTATSLEGPWTSHGNVAPKGTLTWNSQSTFVLPVMGSIDTTYIFMGDRWSHPRQRSSATYVWQPLVFNGDKISLPDFKERWKINTKTGEWRSDCITGRITENTNPKLSFKGDWQHGNLEDSINDSRSNEVNASCTLSFTGRRIAIESTANSDGGYAKVELKNSKGLVVISTTIDMYCKYQERSIKFLSPVLKKDTYTLTISVIGAHWFWVEKSGRKSGSNGDFISINKFIVE